MSVPELIKKEIQDELDAWIDTLEIGVQELDDQIYNTTPDYLTPLLDKVGKAGNTFWDGFEKIVDIVFDGGEVCEES